MAAAIQDHHLGSRENSDEKPQVRFCTRYNKVPIIQRLFRKKWKILRSDPILKTSLNPHSNLVFRRPKDLKSIIAPCRIQI